ncbi:MAG: DNA replication and repair protein RecF [Treponema sp.]|nr:DNA replication and repair protein RecF [Treponema sp.]
MAFSSLRTTSFRNLADAEADLNGKDIFLIGENGQGKTNFMEALYFASYGSSFRGVKDSELVRSGEKDCSVTVKIDHQLYSGISVILRDGKKNIVLDGKRVEDRKNLLSIAPCIVFCHEDMEFVTGTPERRRWFFDQTQSLPDPLYLQDLQNYRKILKTRNSLLKNDPNRRSSGRISAENSALLDALDPQLVQYGLQLMEKRRREVQTFSGIFEPLYRSISGLDGISISYIPSWKDENSETVLDELLGRRETDYSFGLTMSGPHRDRYLFTRKNSSRGTAEFSGRASTGQRRLLALLLRIAQSRIFSEKTGKAPVLLLDDVLLELDGEKRKKFLSLMPDYDQAFFTFLPEEPYNLYRKKDTMVYLVQSGNLKKEGNFP